MPTIKLACPHCAGHVEAQDDWVGQEAECPHCGKAMTIREPALPVAQPSTASQPEQTPPACQPLSAGETKECPFCAEIIKAQAVTCRYCKADLSGARPTLVDSREGKSRTNRATPYILLGLLTFCTMVILLVAFALTVGFTKNWNAGLLVLGTGTFLLIWAVLKARNYIATNWK